MLKENTFNEKQTYKRIKEKRERRRETKKLTAFRKSGSELKKKKEKIQNIQ